MFKKIMCFVLVTLFITPYVEAQSYPISRERFVHLSEEEKEKVIISIMEMMVEMESKYQTYTQVHGYDQELHKRYTSIMNVLSNFLMGNAHADEVKMGQPWTAYASSFVTSLESSTVAPEFEGKIGKKCMFSGWVSRIQFVEGKAATPGGKKPKYRVCAHPQDIKDHNLPEYKSYQESKTGKGCSAEQISCNPAIFGFKKIADKSPFCVFARLPDKAALQAETPVTSPSAVTSDPSIPPLVEPEGPAPEFDDKNLLPTKLTQDSSNASYNCMRLAMGFYDEKLEKDKKKSKSKSAAAAPESPESKPDSKEVRLAFLKSAYEAEGNKQFQTSILDFTSKMCLCDNSQPTELDEKYLKGIRPHRTCYGLMEMVGQDVTACYPPSVEVAPLNLELKFFRDLQTYTHNTGITAGNVEARYEAQLKKFKKSPEYGYYCQGKARPGVPAPTPAPVAKTYKCNEIKFVENECTVDTTTAEPAAPTAPPLVTAEGAPVAPAPRKITCKAKIVENSQPEVIIATVNVNDLEGKTGIPVEFPTGNGDEKKTTTCDLPAAPPAEALPTCQVAGIAAANGAVTASATITPSEGIEILNRMWTPENTNTDTPSFQHDITKDLPIGLKIEFKKAGVNKTIDCTPGKYTAPLPSDPSIQVTAGAKTATSQTAIGKVSGEFTGWKTKWFTKGEKPPKAKAEQTTAPVATDSTVEADPLVATATAPTPAFTAFSKEESANAESTQDMPRHEDEYQICAKLTNADRQSGESCIAVPKLEAAPAPAAVAEAAKPEVKIEKPKTVQPAATPLPSPMMPPFIPRRTINANAGSM